MARSWSPPTRTCSAGADVELINNCAVERRLIATLADTGPTDPTPPQVQAIVDPAQPGRRPTASTRATSRSAGSVTEPEGVGDDLWLRPDDDQRGHPGTHAHLHRHERRRRRLAVGDDQARRDQAGTPTSSPGPKKKTKKAKAQLQVQVRRAGRVRVLARRRASSSPASPRRGSRWSRQAQARRPGQSHRAGNRGRQPGQVLLEAQAKSASASALLRLQVPDHADPEPEPRDR